MVGYLAQVTIRMYLIVSDMAFAYWARYPYGTEDLAQGEETVGLATQQKKDRLALSRSSCFIIPDC